FLAVSGGEIVEKRLVGASDGTDICVRNLFYNLPVREKFMGSDRAETTRIVDFVSRTAVAWPEIRFRMTSNGNILFASTGKKERWKTIFTVFGPGLAEGLIEVGGQTENMRLSAYISAMDKSRKSKRAQTIFVNGRYVKDRILSDAIGEAYDGYLPMGRFPVIYLFLDIDPALIDVNVHPTKLEIRFRNPKEVKTFLTETIRSTLSSGEAMPQLAIPQTRKAQSLAREEHDFYRFKGEPGVHFKGEPGVQSGSALTEGAEGNRISEDGISGDKNGVGDGSEFLPRVNIKTLWTAGGADSANPPAKTATGEAVPSFVRETVSSESKYSAEQPGEVQLALHDEQPGDMSHVLQADKLMYIGSVFATYLLAESAGRFYIIDQHAAHERIHYERFLAEMRRKEHLSQALLNPYLLQIPPSMCSDAEDWAAFFTDLGFEAELFGKTSIRFRAFPAFLKFEEAEAFLADIVLEGGTALPIGDRALERLISRACRSSIKANEKLNEKEAIALLEQLSACENPYTCPHGRPVLVQLRKYDFERMFGRV
ncbi:MAG: DNA mismatch repair endonuclease MutL, partial [Clostridiales Family XIII bacterium]|nr:DNA mismatch repair endonuclease MutL [Clostridiales Family XIII bacterium]